MENPTRGLDVRSGNWTWHHLREQLPEDGAIIFASPDLEEIMEQASRVIVFFDGRIILDRPVDETDLDEISRAITGQVNSECQSEKGPQNIPLPSSLVSPSESSPWERSAFCSLP